MDVAVEGDALPLIQRMAAGDRDAFQRFYDRYATLVYSFSLKLTRQPADAEELLQEVFLQVWNHAGTYNAARGKPEAWLITITRSRAIDLIRSRRRREGRVLPVEDLSRVERPQELTGDRLAAETVQEILHLLPPEQREALELAYFQGMTQTEIAEKLQIPVGTVKTRIRGGLPRLRANMATTTPGTPA